MGHNAQYTEPTLSTTPTKYERRISTRTVQTTGLFFLIGLNMHETRPIYITILYLYPPMTCIEYLDMSKYVKYTLELEKGGREVLIVL